MLRETLVRASMRFTGLVAVLALLGSSGALFAQEQAAPAAPGPYRGVFGGAWNDPTYRRTLDFSLSLLEAFDDNLLVDTLGAAPVYQTSGTYTGLSGSMEFQSRGDRLQTRVSSGSNLRYYPSLRQTLAVSHFEGAGLVVRLPARTTVTVNQTAVYSPSYLYGLFANAAVPTVGALITPAADYAVNATRTYAYAATAQVSKEVGRRGTVSFNAGLQRTEPIGSEATVFRLKSSDIGGRFTYAWTRNATLRLGYQSRNVTFSSPVTIKERNLDIGVDYQRALSRSRRTALGFSAGTTSFTGPVFNAPPNTIAQQYGISVDASLIHRIGRTWNVRGVYHRGVNIISGFQVPLYTDAVSVTALGFVSRRADLTGSAGYSTGNSILVTTRSRVTSYTADARLRFALSRTWATSVEYLYYFYDFDRSLQLPLGVTPRLQRNSVHVGLTWWVPAWRRR